MHKRNFLLFSLPARADMANSSRSLCSAMTSAMRTPMDDEAIIALTSANRSVSAFHEHGFHGIGFVKLFGE